jgi:hypothetical protein
VAGERAEGWKECACVAGKRAGNCPQGGGGGPAAGATSAAAQLWRPSPRIGKYHTCGFMV